MKYIIVAYDRNRVIGGGNKLLWQGHMKADMRRVKQLTTGNAIIMGRKTYESIGRALPNRQNIVVTHRPLEAEGITTVGTLDEAFAAVLPDRDAYIFGGGQIYKQALPVVDQIFATEIDKAFNGDIYFPTLGDDWHEITREDHQPDAENKYPYSFVTYAKTNLFKAA